MYLYSARGIGMRSAKIGNGLSVFSADQIFESIRFNCDSASLPLRRLSLLPPLAFSSLFATHDRKKGTSFDKVGHDQ